jgi:hypothetical protein
MFVPVCIPLNTNILPILFLYLNTVIVTAGTFERNESGRFGALKSDSTHHFFRNACRVIIKDAISSVGELKAGVPQGSELDPLLFLVFINDIADDMLGLGRLFADDTSIGHTAHDETTTTPIVI